MMFILDFQEKMAERVESKIDSYEPQFRNVNFGYVHLILLGTFVYLGFLLLSGTSDLIQGDYPIYSKVIDGAVCVDGWRSNSTGSGTCSHHGGVDYYVYINKRTGYHNSKPNFYFLQVYGIVGLLVLLSLMSKWLRYSIFLQVLVLGRIVMTPILLIWIPFFLIATALRKRIQSAKNSLGKRSK
jgi:hypothetical protein